MGEGLCDYENDGSDTRRVSRLVRRRSVCTTTDMPDPSGSNGISAVVVAVRSVVSAVASASKVAGGCISSGVANNR
jgi:hypothetical protein